MKAKYLFVIPLVAIVALKILVSTLFLIFSRKFFLAALGIGLVVKTGILSAVCNFFKKKKTKNSDIIIEVKPIKLD